MSDILYNKPSGEKKNPEDWKCSTKAKSMSSTGGITVHYYGDERCSASNVSNYNFRGPKITFTFPNTTVDFSYACSDTSQPDMKNLFNWKHPTDSRPQIKITPDNVLACRQGTNNLRTVEVMLPQGIFKISI